ncbi:hypothetical protein M8C21_005616, partial [Ambrosia artemisiifolia]
MCSENLNGSIYVLISCLILICYQTTWRGLLTERMMMVQIEYSLVVNVLLMESLARH